MGNVLSPDFWNWLCYSNIIFIIMKSRRSLFFIYILIGYCFCFIIFDWTQIN